MTGIAWALMVLLTGPAWAHKASDAYLQVTQDGHRVHVRLDVALRDLDRDLVLDADDDGVLRWGEIRSRSTELEKLVAESVVIDLRDVNGVACEAGAFEPLKIDSHSDGRYAVLQRAWTCVAAPLGLGVDYRLFAATDPTHRGVLLLTQGTERRTVVLAPGAPSVQLALSRIAGGSQADGVEGGEAGLLTIFKDGVHHIWIGIDHVLFLIVLLLPAVLRREQHSWKPAPRLRASLMEVLGVVTAFTVAHSITLGLAAFEVVDPPSRWVESLIALSVLLAALNNLKPVLLKARWKLTFCFGMVHGFGFASALRDLGLARGDLAGPLLMFNLGVEAGQLVIVALLVPVLWGLRRWRGYPDWVLRAGSVLAALMALLWLVERLFDIKLMEIGG